MSVQEKTNLINSGEAKGPDKEIIYVLPVQTAAPPNFPLRLHLSSERMSSIKKYEKPRKSPL